MSKNGLPLDIDVEEGRANITIFKMDSGSYMLQNNDKGQGDDRLQIACSSVDNVMENVKAIFGQFQDAIRKNVTDMDKKWQGFDVAVIIDHSSDGIEEDLELSSEMNLNVDQIVEVFNDLIGQRPIIKNAVYGVGNRGLGFSKADIYDALAKAGNPNVINRPRVQPGNKKHFFDKKKRTEFGNKLPDDKNRDQGRGQNQPTKIEVEKKD